jgi:hypothetical protein
VKVPVCVSVSGGAASGDDGLLDDHVVRAAMLGAVLGEFAHQW